MKNKGKAVELVVTSLPYPAQIKDWDLESEADAIRFSWRGSRYRFSFTGAWMVEEIQGSMLAGTDQAILIEALIHTTYKYMR
jgi:hypothetical protein